MPGCPDWTLRDLVVHVGHVQQSWAGHVRAGDAHTRPVTDTPAGDLLEWSAASTEALGAALRDAGPDAPCWTWWGDSGAPCNAGAVARHQVQEAALHAWDAQSAVGAPRDLPSAIAVDCVDEFLVVGLESNGEWPHPFALIDVVTADGPRWTVRLATGATVEKDPQGTPNATIAGPAGDLILALYSRLPLERLSIDGDREVVGHLLDWVGEATA